MILAPALDNKAVIGKIAVIPFGGIPEHPADCLCAAFAAHDPVIAA